MSWNRGAERILGYTAEEIIGQHVSILMPPEALEDTREILGRIRRGEKVDHYRTRRRRKDGTVIDVSLTVSPIRDEAGEIVGASKVGRDVTEKRRSPDLLEERLAAVVESSDDVIITKNLDGIITSWNRGAQRVLGYTADEVIGQHVSMLMPPEFIEDTEADPGPDPPRAEKVDHYETRRRRGDGHHRRVADGLSPIRNSEGEVVRPCLQGRPRHHHSEARRGGTPRVRPPQGRVHRHPRP